MNKKTGFTLVEIIAVVSLIAIIGLMVIPKVTTLINESKATGYNTTISTIKDAAKTYAYLNTKEIDDKIEVNSYYDISILKLQQEGLLDMDLKDTRTDTNISTSSGIRITKMGNKYEYTYITTLSNSSLVKLTVDLNGGSTSQTFSANYNEGATITLVKPTRNSFLFSNWIVEGKGSSIDNEVLTIGSTNTTIIANWGRFDSNFEINYILNEGEVNGTNPNSYKSNDEPITLINPTKTGYTFSGWTGSNGTTPQTTVTIATGSSGNKEYTANWLENTYVVQYNCNGGSGSTTNSSHTYDVEKTLSLNGCIKPLITGNSGNIYYFNGWSTSPTATSGYEDGASVINLTSVNNGEVILYAIWDNLFEYTGGTYNLSGTVSDWKLKFTSNGTFTINKSTVVDIFVVGGGGGGAGQFSGSDSYLRSGGGGGGGYAKTWLNETINSSYTVTIGIGGSGGDSGVGVTASSGGSSSFGTNYVAPGGAGGTTPDWGTVNNPTILANGGAGGSGGGAGGHNSQWGNGKGGVGGSNGGSGGNAVTSSGDTTTAYGGSGQFNQYGSTYEFGGSSGTLYSGGGGGGSSNLGSNGSYCASGGSGGGGTGGCSSNVHGTAGTSNTGGGGGGAYGEYAKKYAGSDGGSGIVIIRNHR